jgi:hypothetical protein
VIIQGEALGDMFSLIFMCTRDDAFDLEMRVVYVSRDSVAMFTSIVYSGDHETYIYGSMTEAYSLSITYNVNNIVDASSSERALFENRILGVSKNHADRNVIKFCLEMLSHNSL